MVLKPVQHLLMRLLAATLAAALAACSAGSADQGGVRHGDAADTIERVDPPLRVFGDYAVRPAPPDELTMEPPKLPDLSPYTAEALIAKMERKPGGRAYTHRMVNDQALDEFIGGDGRMAVWAARQRTNPLAIRIEGGYMTPADLAKQLPARHFEHQGDGVYVARLPIVVGQGATLHIDESVKDFRLSQERGSFLVNDGYLFVTGTRLTAWSESRNGPAKYRGKPEEFRPFLVSWGGAEMYMLDTVVTSFGYAASKSYGVSISQYSPSVDKILHRPRPTGWLLGNTFDDMWYGFYCYEADDVVILDNIYKHNIVYGIDPHDRSKRLIIARNTAYGTKKKHGIIISREVDDSWIFNNVSHDNGLSGIVIDRMSKNNVVAYNEVYANGSDGITIYESPDNLLWGNRSVANAKHGIRVRNSLDIKLYENVVIGNAYSGIYGHIKDLTGTDRDLRLDPFDPTVSLVVVGGQMIGNHSGPVHIDQPLSVELYDVDLLAPLKSDGLRLKGILGEFQNEILHLLLRQRTAVVIEPNDNLQRSVGA